MRRKRPEGSKRLIVNADDFGIDVAVNEAVEEAFTKGVLTSASLMVNGPALADAVERARRLKGLAVGLHLDLIEGRPVMSPKRVPGLIDKNGRFRKDMVMSGVRWAFSPRIKAQLSSEIAAQFNAFAKTGLVLDHVNSHQHLHLHPTVNRLVVMIGKGYGAPALRVPKEPRSVIRRIEPGKRIPGAPFAPLLFLMRRRAIGANFVVNDSVFGLAWSGAMTEDRLLGLIAKLPPGISEIYLHPATADAAAMPHAVSTYRYRDELAALTSPKVKEAIAANGITLTRYSALTGHLTGSGAAPASPASPTIRRPA